MKRAVLFTLPLLLVGVAAVLLAQPGLQVDKPYEFKLGKDITAEAGEVTIEPKFKAVADDKFEYESYFNATRTGTAIEGGQVIESFRYVENWVNLFTLVVSEDPLDGRKDSLVGFRFDLLQFTIDNGEARYTGFIGPNSGTRKAGFQEVLADGKRSDVTNIPGWAGINANTVEMNRSGQARDYSASAWFSVSDHGRLYNETYYADWGNPDQTNYPGRLQDPLQLALGTQPEFVAETKLKIGESVTVCRRMPVGAGGGTIDYDVTYKLEKLYGTKEEPTAARFSFDAVPVQREHTVTVAGLTTSFSAPDIKGGKLLMDLAKGVAAHVQWEYALSGTVAQAGTNLSTKFDVKLDFSASLRKGAETPE